MKFASDLFFCKNQYLELSITNYIVRLSENTDYLQYTRSNVTLSNKSRMNNISARTLNFPHHCCHLHRDSQLLLVVALHDLSYPVRKAVTRPCHSLVHSHWSRNVEARLSLVESFPSDAGAKEL